MVWGLRLNLKERKAKVHGKYDDYKVLSLCLGLHPAGFTESGMPEASLLSNYNGFQKCNKSSCLHAGPCGLELFLEDVMNVQSPQTSSPDHPLPAPTLPSGGESQPQKQLDLK